MKVIVSRRKIFPFRRSRAELFHHSRSSTQNADDSLPSDVDETEQNIEFKDDHKCPDCDISSDDPKDSQSESHESAIEENDSTQMEAEPEFFSTNNLPRLSVSNQLSSHRSNAKDALSDSVEQTDRADKSGKSIRRKKKQTRGRVKRFNNYADTEKDAAVRENRFSLRINSKESRTFACTECEQRFNHKDHLEAHFRIHTREKPFACTDCGFAFSRRDHLIRHMRTHDGKSRKCEICQKTFRQRSHLVSHFRKIHGQKSIGIPFKRKF